MRAIQRFEVSLKAFLVRDRRVLLLREADTGYWELPGGRIDVGEERLDHEAILRRELTEELGPAIRFEVAPLATSLVRQRPTDGVFQFLLVRLCRHRSGDLRLSDEHTGHAWTAPDDWPSLAFPQLSDYHGALARAWRQADLDRAP
jgi:8-oxo-dGTP pyrophosphatase MutT (NUDIX family)